MWSDDVLLLLSLRVLYVVARVFVQRKIRFPRVLWKEFGMTLFVESDVQTNVKGVLETIYRARGSVRLACHYDEQIMLCDGYIAVKPAGGQQTGESYRAEISTR